MQPPASFQALRLLQFEQLLHHFCILLASKSKTNLRQAFYGLCRSRDSLLVEYIAEMFSQSLGVLVKAHRRLRREALRLGLTQIKARAQQASFQRLIQQERQRLTKELAAKIVGAKEEAKALARARESKQNQLEASLVKLQDQERRVKELLL
jgi:hypothetical protein